MLSGKDLKKGIISGANNIFNNQEYVNSLNVFPVPDGDTGSNMARTMNSAKILLESESDELTVGEILKLTASALLRGARGNSGVILSLIFRGLAKGLEGRTTATAGEFAKAFEFATESAYGAVAKPTEGTILTVVRLLSQNAGALAADAKDFAGFWQAVCKKAKEILLQTPDFLPVLAEASVVDSGAQGLVLIFEGMNEVFSGKGAVEIKGEKEQQRQKAAGSKQPRQEVEFGYCTEFLLNKDKRYEESTEGKLKKFLESVGGSVVFVDGGEIVKVHVHTNHPGEVLEKALGYGFLTDIKIDNLQEEVDEQDRKLAAEKNIFEYKPVDENLEYGFVAVAAGQGIKDMFKELGVLNVISGGQTMNPSTEEIVAAINATPAKTVFVLPNNKNVVLTAEQAGLMADRKVIVLPSRTIPQGVNALLAFAETADVQANQLAMVQAIERVKTGLITTAAKDSRSSGKEIKEGDVLGIENGRIKYVEKDIARACFKLVKGMVKKQSGYVTVFYGEEVGPELVESLGKQLNQKLGDIEINMISGGQPVYHFIVGVE